jgi:D-glycero-D-manno-heptose 1,7-bisphosphate phosphatase
MASLNAIHAKMHRAVNQAGGRIEAVFYCPDTDESQSPCRKPNPGMFHAIAERLNVALDEAPCVGDSLRDLQAAAAVGGQPILVLTGKGRKTRAAGGLPEATKIYPDLAAVAQVLCQ